MGQPVKRYLASCRVDRGSRAGKLEQQNGGGNAKPARFAFRSVARAQSVDRVYANQRTSERANQQTTKQLTKARTNERTSKTKIMPKSLSGRFRNAFGTVREGLKSSKKSLRIALGAALGDAGALGLLRERSRTALGHTRDGPRTLPGRPRDGLWRSQEALGRFQNTSESARDEFCVRPWRKSLPKGSQSDFCAILCRSRLVAQQF